MKKVRRLPSTSWPASVSEVMRGLVASFEAATRDDVGKGQQRATLLKAIYDLEVKAWQRDELLNALAGDKVA